jgi:hypothetical protein
MSDDFLGVLQGKDDQDNSVRVSIDANHGMLKIGGAGRGGDVALTDDAGTATIFIDAGGSEGESGGGPVHLSTDALLRAGATTVITGNGEIDLGGHRRTGWIKTKNKAGKEVVVAGGEDGWVSIRNSEGAEVVSIGGAAGTGDLYLRNSSGQFTIALRAVEGHNAGAWIGGTGQTGWVTVRNKAGKDVAVVGGEDGWVSVRNAEGSETVALGGDSGTGDVYLKNASNKFTIALRAVEDKRAGIWVGGNGQDGIIVLRDAEGEDQVWLDGKAGDIVLVNADCAEEFDVQQHAEPGTVLVLGDTPGKLSASSSPYDTRVAGVVASAGSQRPGILLGRREGPGRAAVALTGRTYCRVEADTAAIGAGTLLTTSSVPGHAMAATDRDRAFGAVLGKALTGLDRGRGLLPVLVALQ